MKKVLIFLIVFLLIGIIFISGYTYEENQEDSKCVYKLNFCNIDYNLTEEIPSTAQDVIYILKQVNYQMQGDLTNYQNNKNLIFILFVISLTINFYLFLKLRKIKLYSQKNGYV